jgi:putative cardiolipin synthase
LQTVARTPAEVTLLRPLGRMVADKLAQLGGPGVASLVSEGMLAFAARVMLARTAEHTLDLQYYAWDDDNTGRLLALEVLKAADRGVKVRMLLDDTTVVGRDKSFQTMDQHPNIEVRVFNATTWRAHGLLGFGIEFALGGWHLNHRMHNKAWIADGKAAVIGGRNIGDRYFDGSGLFNFRDLDVVLLGPSVERAVAIFELFWKHAVVQGIQFFMKRRKRRLRRKLAEFRARLETACEADAVKPYLAELQRSYGLPERLAEQLPFDAVDGVEILSDRPEKANDRRAAMIVGDRLREVMAAARGEVIMISPYFVPGREGTELIQKLRRQGVEVRVVTNTLAANDVTAVHSGYARYRRKLLESGVIVHELKNTPGEKSRIFGSSGASLHTKAVVVDRRIAFVGSFNLDHRSQKLNTEMGVLITDDHFAQCVVEQYERLADPNRSYRVSLESDGLRWRAELDGNPVESVREPNATLMQRVVSTVVGWLPMEAQL